MKLTQKVSQRLETRLALSQDLHRAIGLLELSNLDLAQTLHEAASDNPWLRLRAPPALADLGAEIADPGPSLRGHVLGQLDRLVPVAADRPIALALIDALGPNGFLDTPPEALATALRVPLMRVEAVLSALQRIEPRGLFARSLADCLALQLAEEGALTPPIRRVLDALPLLAEQGAPALAAAAGVALDDLTGLLAQLRRLNPRPAAGFASDTARIRVADLLFEADGPGWHARLNPESLPRIDWAEAPGGPGGGAAFRQERRAARQLLGAVERRNATLLALGALLARVQAGFLSDGPIGQQVLTLREAARQLDLHESTVGRLAGATSAATPAMGVVPLREFFCRPVRRGAEGAGHAAPAIAARIAALIADEDPRRPLFDGQIAQTLCAEGLIVSRRVVARLRAQDGIPNRASRRAPPA